MIAFVLPKSDKWSIVQNRNVSALKYAIPNEIRMGMTFSITLVEHLWEGD
jgi:hypothetical protein